MYGSRNPEKVAEGGSSGRAPGVHVRFYALEDLTSSDG